MLAYKIISNGTTPKSDITPPQGKEAILKRALLGCRFKPGDRIKVRGTPFIGTVVELLEEVHVIPWRNNSPQFIHIELDGGTHQMAHTSQLKGSSK
jgi:hypothetical protein